MMLRTSHRIVSEVRPKWTACRPISRMSPCVADDTNSISEMYFVTIRWLPSWIIA